jgi:hypothetical protein
MVLQALAADTLAGAGFIRTVAVMKIYIFVALSHPKTPIGFIFQYLL